MQLRTPHRGKAPAGGLPVAARFTGLVLAAVFGLATAAWAFDPDPPWKFPEQPWRAVFQIKAAEPGSVLVALPRNSTCELKPGAEVVAVDSAGTVLPSRLVHAGSDEAAALVRVPVSSGELPMSLYFGKPPAAGKAPGAADTMHDPRAVSLEVRSSVAQNVPGRWEQMLYLFVNGAPVNGPIYREGFGAYELFSEPGEREGRRRGRWIAKYSAHVLCAADGIYRFALDGVDAAFVLVDGEHACEWPGEHEGGEWRQGKPIMLKAGVHRVEVFHAARARGVLRVGWVRPGRPDVVLLGASDLLTAREPSTLRYEAKTRPVQPDFAWQAQPSYAFRGIDSIFTPVTFKNGSRHWETHPVECRWRFSDGAQMDGDTAAHIFNRAGRHKAALEIRDPMGFKASIEKIVDVRWVLPRQYPLVADVLDVPAVGYGDDGFSPRLDAEGELPAGASLDVSIRSVDTAGVPVLTVTNLTLKSGTESIPLPRRQLGSMRELVWEIRHGGHALLGGRIRFLKPPFQELPARVQGDRLFGKSGDRLVLVPRRVFGEYRQPVFTTTQVFGRLLCVDDFLAVPGLPGGDRITPYYVTLERILDGPGRPVMAYLPLAGAGGSPESYDPLQKLVQIPAAATGATDIVVLSLGVSEMRLVRDAGVFERRMAALSDLLSETLKRPVLWVTVPPYPDDGRRSREFAAAIQRVADARGIPVADLYTSLSGLRDDVRSFLSGRDNVLSERGQNLAAMVMARALLME